MFSSSSSSSPNWRLKIFCIFSTSVLWPCFFFFLTNSPLGVSAKEIQMHIVSTLLMCAVVKVVVCSLKTCNRITSTKSRTFGRLTGYFFYLFFSLQEQQCAERERGIIVRWQGWSYASHCPALDAWEANTLTPLGPEEALPACSTAATALLPLLLYLAWSDGTGDSQIASALIFFGAMRK